MTPERAKKIIMELRLLELDARNAIEDADGRLLCPDGRKLSREEISVELDKALPVFVASQPTREEFQNTLEFVILTSGRLYDIIKIMNDW